LIAWLLKTLSSRAPIAIAAAAIAIQAAVGPALDQQPQRWDGLQDCLRGSIQALLQQLLMKQEAVHHSSSAVGQLCSLAQLQRDWYSLRQGEQMLMATTQAAEKLCSSCV
jgi:hypothetical protein